MSNAQFPLLLLTNVGVLVLLGLYAPFAHRLAQPARRAFRGSVSAGVGFVVGWALCLKLDALAPGVSSLPAPAYGILLGAATWWLNRHLEKSIFPQWRARTDAWELIWIFGVGLLALAGTVALNRALFVSS